MNPESLGEYSEPRYIVENVVNRVVPLEPMGYVSPRQRRKLERRREEARSASHAALSWWSSQGRDLYILMNSHANYLDPDALYEDAYGFVLEALGIGWIGSFFVSWAVKMAVTLIMNWLLSADSIHYREQIERNVSHESR